MSPHHHHHDHRQQYLPYFLACSFMSFVGSHRAQWYNTSQQLITQVQSQTKRYMETLPILSTMATTLSLSGNTTTHWPFVTLPHFDAWAGEWNRIVTTATDNSTLTMGVIVSDGQQLAWNNYSSTHVQDWVHPTPSSSNIMVPTTSSHKVLVNYIWKYDVTGNRVADVQPVTTQYAVSWQSTPVQPQLINQNDLDSPVFQQAWYLKLVEFRYNVWFVTVLG